MSDLKTRAHALIPPFLSRKTAGKFCFIRREDIAEQLAERIDKPGKIGQHTPSLSSRASILNSIAYSDPVAYARFAIDLYEQGRARLRGLDINPNARVRRSCAKPGVPVLDSMTLESLQGSRNWFLVYQRAIKVIPGVTPPIEMLRCFKRAGYRTVINDASLSLTKGTGNLSAANKYFRQRYKVCVLINKNMIEGRLNRISTYPKPWECQWLALSSDIRVLPNSVSFGIITKSGRHDHLTAARLSKERFLDNYHGFIACSE